MLISKQIMLGCAAALAAAVALPVLAQPAPTPLLAYTPKPVKLPGYGRNKPVTRLSDVLAKHKGQSSWTEQVIKTGRFDTRWVQMAPGEKLSTRYYGDDRVMWVVWQGQIRFNIEGQEPFVAAKGFLVQVPQRVRYSMETVGSEPALRYEVTRAGQLPNFPADNGEAKPGLCLHVAINTVPVQQRAQNALPAIFGEFARSLHDVTAAGAAARCRLCRGRAKASRRSDPCRLAVQRREAFRADVPVCRIEPT